MSARQSPVERDARKIAVRDLHLTREYRHDKSARELLDTSAADLAREAARAVLRGDIPEARRYARAHQLLSESARRLTERHEREREAKRAAEAAEHGITAGDVVRVTRGGAGTQVPVGTVCVIEDVSGVFLYTTHDGAQSILWARDVELVDEPPTAPDPLQIGEDVLTPGRGAGVVEHVDLVSGVTVRCADGETWRYEPEQLTRVTPADDERCSACAAHPGWAHGDQTRRSEPRDICRVCFGSGTRQPDAWGATAGAQSEYGLDLADAVRAARSEGSA